MKKNEGIIVSPYYYICDEHEIIHVTQYTCKCKKGQKLISKKGTKTQVKKFRKKIGFNKTKKSKKNK